MAFWKFTGTQAEEFPSLAIVAQPGYVYDLGSAAPPNEPLSLDGALSPSPLTKWTSDPGPATDYRVLQASDVAGSYASLYAQQTAALIPCSTRANHLMPLLSGGTYTSATYRVAHVATCDITSLSLWYPNYTINATPALTDGPNTITVRNAIEIPSTGSRLRGFSREGARSLVIDPGGGGWLDVPVTIPKGTVYYEWVYVSCATGGQWPLPLGFLIGTANLSPGNFDSTLVGASAGEGDNLTTGGADVTASGTVPGKYDTAYSASLILGTTYDPKPVVVGVAGDSIITGANDLAQLGFIPRALNNQYNILKLSRGGDKASLFVNDASRDWRSPLIRYITHGISNYGRNDLSNGDSLATIQTNLIKVWGLLAANGSKWWQTTITPKTTSTDNWTTLTGQTVTSDNATRLALNAWLRDGAPMHLSGGAWAYDAVGATGPGIARCAVNDKTGTQVTAASGPKHLLVGVLEAADLVESARDSGKWRVDRLRTVTDGAIDVSTYNNQFLFNSATMNATADDIGKVLVIPGAASSAGMLQAMVGAIGSASQVSMFTYASTAVTGATVQIGAPTTDGLHPSGDLHRQLVPIVPLAQFVNP